MYMSGACALYSKNTDLNLKNSWRMQMKNHFTGNTLNYLNDLSPDIMNTIFKLRQSKYL